MLLALKASLWAARGAQSLKSRIDALSRDARTVLLVGGPPLCGGIALVIMLFGFGVGLAGSAKVASVMALGYFGFVGLLIQIDVTALRILIEQIEAATNRYIAATPEREAARAKRREEREREREARHRRRMAQREIDLRVLAVRERSMRAADWIKKAGPIERVLFGWIALREIQMASEEAKQISADAQVVNREKQPGDDSPWGCCGCLVVVVGGFGWGGWWLWSRYISTWIS